MDNKRKPIKRRGKTAHKKLNMNKASGVENKPKTTLNQRVNEFKSSGLTLLKGKQSDKKTGISFKLVLITVAVVLISALVLTTASAPTGIVEFIGVKKALSKSGESFPVEYDFSTGGDVVYSNGSVLVVNESDLKCYNRTGNLIYSRIHGFATPIVKTSEVRTLVYGLNDSHYLIETAEKEVLSKNTDNNAPIIAGDISDCGVFALVTEGTEDIALVTVYDKKGNEKYKYHSANNYVTSVTVSENGKQMCVVSLSTKQAEFVSKLSVYDFNSTKPVFETELEDEVVYEAEYSNSKKVAIITDKRFLTLQGKKINKSIKHNPESINKYEISDKYILIYNTADNNSSDGIVRIYSLDGNEKAEFIINGNISDISVYNKRIYTLGEKVTEYDFKGNVVKVTEINNGAVKIAACKKGTVILYSSGVDFIKEG